MKKKFLMGPENGIDGTLPIRNNKSYIVEIWGGRYKKRVLKKYKVKFCY